MKIAVISTDRTRLESLGRALEVSSHSISLITGGMDNLRAIAQQEAPALILVDGMAGNAGELGQAEYVSTHYPHVAIIVICANITPDFLIAAMRAGVREVLPSPAPAAALEAAINRLAAKLAGSQVKNPGKVLAFMPCKGGSGATFLATNLGYLLAENQSVLLIDLNLQFGDALSFIHDGEPASTIADVTRDIRRLDASFLDSSTVKITPNYSILAAPADANQAVGIKLEHIDAILGLAVAHYDFVLIDLPRTLDPITIKALDRATLILSVLQANLPALRHAKKMLTLFQSLGYTRDKVALIVNRFDKRAEIGIDDMRRLLGTITLHTVPNSYKEVSTSINHGNSLIEAARSSPVTRNLAEFALSLAPAKKDNRSLLDRIFKRSASEPLGFNTPDASSSRA
ncbi:AAA family ATPase [Janthinobacterium sp. 17J80-10]|uniref:AAA family ATPase n=1 Tax=Janthinobacterium sp. 17J80-10 TaxID=2497863 RepID=UPI0010056947|nr:AAA family ATPase [Janthinobacterium sp. 17J80-10]QAU33452.1 histidine kinase [Janthinobacterium sp. 17J80-10]